MSPHTPLQRKFEQRRRFDGLACDGCDKSCNYWNRDYYMVHDKVWVEEAGLSLYNCQLCRSCLSVRLGRPLTLDDYTSVPVNALIYFDYTVVLLASLL